MVAKETAIRPRFQYTETPRNLKVSTMAGLFRLKMTSPNCSIPYSLLYPCPHTHPKLTSNSLSGLN